MVRRNRLSPWRQRQGVILLTLLTLTPIVGGCVQEPPPELLQALQALDRQLVAVQGAEFAPDEYARFVEQWVAAQQRLLTEEDVISWPWETNQLVDDLRKVHQTGLRAVSAAQHRREAAQRTTKARLADLEQRHRTFTKIVEDLGSRVLLGESPMETALLVKQARTFFTDGQFTRSKQAIQRAHRLLNSQTAVLTNSLGRYAEADHLSTWHKMVRHTVEWSRHNNAVGIVVSKADRRLTLYRNGRPVLSYPVRLGFNGLADKRYQGDGATPEGQYRVVRNRDRGHTKFYRAFLLDYPNEEDRRRFRSARRAQAIPVGSLIGGEIEIHGGDDQLLSQTLGCIMLDNWQIDRLFESVEVGTPVTIVGATESSNPVALALAALEAATDAGESQAAGGQPGSGELHQPASAATDSM